MEARLDRRALLGIVAAAGAVALTGCIAETTPRGPVVPTPTVARRQPIAVGGTPGRFAGRTFRVTGAGDDVRESVLATLWQPFAEATGCRLDVGITDYGVLAGDGGEERPDLSLVGDDWAVRLANSGRLVPLEASAVDGTIPDIIPALPTSVPAFADAVVNTSRVDAASPDQYPADWTQWWDFRAIPGGRAMAKGPVGTFEIALLADGVAPAELYPLDLERAVSALRRVSGSVIDRWWETGPQVIDWMAGGRAAFATAYAHQVLTANRDGRPLRMEPNQAVLFSHHWGIPVGAANEDIARDFIAFALSAPAQAGLAGSAGLSPVSTVAFAGIDPVLSAHLPTSPENIGRSVRMDPAWWASERTLATAAFNDWLLGNPRGF